MKNDFITIGGATEDITFYTKEGEIIDNHQDILKQKLLAFEYGAKIKIDASYSNFGGGAANAAVGLSLLGFKVTAFVSIGKDDRGKNIIANFKKHNIDTSLIQKQEVSTGFSFLLTGPGNEHIVFSNRGANDLLTVDEATKKKLSSAKWIYITSLSGKWEQALDAIFTSPQPSPARRGSTFPLSLTGEGRGEGASLRIAWNPGHRQLIAGVGKLKKYLSETSVLIVNKDEALELAMSDKKNQGRQDYFLNNAKHLLELIKSYGPEIVVITCGRDGADAYDGENYYHQDIIKEKKLVDTTGVGDAFGSTFTAGLEIFKGDISKAIHIAAKNTASLIGTRGAQNGLLTRKQILK